MLTKRPGATAATTFAQEMLADMIFKPFEGLQANNAVAAVAAKKFSIGEIIEGESFQQSKNY